MFREIFGYGEVLDKLRDLAAGLHRLDAKVDWLIRQQLRERKALVSIDKEIEDLAAAVQEQTTVEDGVRTLMGQAVQKIDDLAAQIAANADDPEQVALLAGRLRQNTASLRGAADQLAAAVADTSGSSGGAEGGEAPAEPATEDPAVSPTDGQ